MSPEPRSTRFAIGRHAIGNGQPLFVIAEIGLNHGGSVDKALALVDAASRAGASAVKLQTLFASDLVAPFCPPPAHVPSESLRDFFSVFELDEDAHRRVIGRARERGLAVMATPFSLAAVDLLERVGVDAYKIASGDLTWDGLLRRTAATGKPLVISTGMGTLAEARHAVNVVRLGGGRHVALLHCVSAYPIPRGSENLRAMATLATALRVPVGLSDHGDDTFAAPLAVALGGALYERHLVLSHADGSIDDAVSSTPEELAATIRHAARAAEALGAGEKICLPAEAVNVAASRRALYAARPLPAGHVVTAADVTALRPGTGLPAGRETDLVGCRLPRAIDAGQPFRESDCGSQRRHRDVA
jgi:N,N'-diacetyllegionaminate synthase